MPDAVKPANSHVALNTIEDEDGNQRQIVRDNLPFGSVGSKEFGTYFIGYAATPDVIEQMLTNMFVGNPPGTHDRILDFSTAITGTLFFVPTLDFLDDPSGRPGAPAEPDPPAEPSTTEATSTESITTESPRADGSLGIGSLRGSTS
jgi:putative iron-dependent peroxidase